MVSSADPRTSSPVVALGSTAGTAGSQPPPPSHSHSSHSFELEPNRRGEHAGMLRLEERRKAKMHVTSHTHMQQPVGCRTAHQAIPLLIGPRAKGRRKRDVPDHGEEARHRMSAGSALGGVECSWHHARVPPKPRTKHLECLPMAGGRRQSTACPMCCGTTETVPSRTPTALRNSAGAEGEAGLQHRTLLAANHGKGLTNSMAAADKEWGLCIPESSRVPIFAPGSRYDVVVMRAAPTTSMRSAARRPGRAGEFLAEI